MSQKNVSEAVMRLLKRTVCVLAAGVALAACEPMAEMAPAPKLSPAPSCATALGSAKALADQGEAFLTANCARCHVIKPETISPYPGAQPFTKLDGRWRRDELREALRAGIRAEHDSADVKPPLMKASDQQIDGIFAYLDRLACEKNAR